MVLPHRVRAGLAAAVAVALPMLIVASCGGAGPARPAAPAQPVRQQAKPLPPPPPSPASVHANELGKVPVLMYHRITKTPASVYDRSPQDFRAELERLAAEQYVPVSATDYATAHIDIPAGTHPVVLTFDDSSPEQFTMDSSGQPAPDTAVRILLDVAAAHPGFRPVATFYVLNPPFKEPGGKVTLNWLHDHGFEIGNHTLDHPALNKLSDAETQHQIAGLQQLVADAVPGIQLHTIALPLGMHPRQKPLAANGSDDGISYHYDGVMLVGSNPAPSPMSSDFDPLKIPRIRSQASTGQEAQYGSSVWLDKLAADPATRYTSDGDPQHISVPAQSSQQPAPQFAGLVQRY